jgi:CheY-like chemotaxis protein
MTISTNAANVDPKTVNDSALIVDDEPNNRDFMVRLLRIAGLDVHEAESPVAALHISATLHNLTIALIDYQLPEVNGVTILKQIRARHAHAILVMATVNDHRELIDEAFASGANIFLVKPHGFMELFKRLCERPINPALFGRRMIVDQYGERPYRPTLQAPSVGSLSTGA